MQFKAIQALVFAGTLFSAPFLQALPGLKCITGGFPSTSFLLSEESDHVELRVINHNGSKYAPVYNGNATPSDVEHIKKSGDFFEKLGDFFTIKFEKKNCRFEEDRFFTCFLNDESDISGTKIHTIYFSTSESTDRIVGFEFNKKNVRLSLREKPQDFLEYRLEMSYYDGDCEITGK